MAEFDSKLIRAQTSAEPRTARRNKLSCFFCSSRCLVGAKVTLPRPGLWPSRLPRPCRTCSPRPTKLWPTAGRPRQPCTWRAKLSRRSAGLTTPPWTTVAWVSSPPSLAPSLFHSPSSLCLQSFAHTSSRPRAPHHIHLAAVAAVAAAAHLLARHFVHMLTFHNSLSTLSFVQLVLAAVLLNLDIIVFVYGCVEVALLPK